MNQNLSWNYRLVNDIDCSGFDYGDGMGFMPIGEYENEFEGNFDGKEFTISNLYINRGDEDYVGLFRYTSGAEIKNVGLEKVNITGGSGCLVGASKNTIINNSYATGTITGSSTIGGLVGSNMEGSLISNSYATGNVTGNDLDSGGLVGVNNGQITNSHATGNVRGLRNVGGLVGYHEKGSISYSYATGNVSGEYNIGGLVGSAPSSPISNSYATGNVDGTEGVGGLVGSSSDANISNSYSTGIVIGLDKDIGGLVGSGGSISKSYYDKWKNPQRVGCPGSFNEEDSSWEEYCQDSNKTTEQMKNHSMFIEAGWNFSGVWDDILDGVGPPTLKWQKALQGEYVTEINLSEGWNLFSFTKSILNDDKINLTKNLSNGFNFIGYSANENKNFLEIVRINNSDWSTAVSNGWVLNMFLEYNPLIGFYSLLSPSFSLNKHKGYIIYTREEGLNLTFEDVVGSEEIKFEIGDLRVNNTTSGEISKYNDSKEWFYPIAGVGVYEYNGTVDGSETYNELYLEDELKSWESYWIRAKYENLSLIFYG